MITCFDKVLKQRHFVILTLDLGRSISHDVGLSALLAHRYAFIQCT